MAVDDPFVPLRDWSMALYLGEPAAVDRFLDAIDATLPPGWARDREYERTRSRPDRIRWYLFDRAGDAAVKVGLQRVSATRVRGGPVQVLRHPPSGDAGRIVRPVGELAEGCVRPAAGAAGVRCTRPAFGVRSVVPLGTELLLTQLADTADGEWPLTDRVQGLWDELISTGLAEQAALDRTELHRWLEDSGWSPEAATALADRLYSDAEWLARRLAAMAP